MSLRSSAYLVPVGAVFGLVGVPGEGRSSQLHLQLGGDEAVPRGDVLVGVSPPAQILQGLGDLRKANGDTAFNSGSINLVKSTVLRHSFFSSIDISLVVYRGGHPP